LRKEIEEQTSRCSITHFFRTEDEVSGEQRLSDNAVAYVAIDGWSLPEGAAAFRPLNFRPNLEGL
jgi:hypothetical protein